MHKIALTFAALGLSATAALAQTPTTFADVDGDGSGELSYVELQLVWSDLSQAEFDAANADGSDGLSVAELNSLQPAAVPAPTAPTLDAPLDPAAVPQ